MSYPFVRRGWVCSHWSSRPFDESGATIWSGIGCCTCRRLSKGAIIAVGDRMECEQGGVLVENKDTHDHMTGSMQNFHQVSGTGEASRVSVICWQPITRLP